MNIMLSSIFLIFWPIYFRLLFSISKSSLFIISDTVPVGGFCNLSHQCTGSSNSGICENGRCTCAKEFTLKDLACEKSNVTM